MHARYQFVRGQHSGYLEPADGAQHLLDAVAVGYPNLPTWLMRGCQAITDAVAARVQLVLTLHREVGTEPRTDRYPRIFRPPSTLTQASATRWMRGWKFPRFACLAKTRTHIGRHSSSC
jgi:hypothetical protein